MGSQLLCTLLRLAVVATGATTQSLQDGIGGSRDTAATQRSRKAWLISRAGRWPGSWRYPKGEN